MKPLVHFGKYILLERISIGGMAEVFKAKVLLGAGDDPVIAIKRILPTIAEDAGFIQMFIDEARIAGQLHHPDIAQIYELGSVDGSHFIAMEYIWGKDLLQIQNRFRKMKAKMPFAMAGYCAMKIAEALDYAHKKAGPDGKSLEIIHRDVSPQNVLVSYEGEVKVIDFGIAKAAARSTQTQAGVLKGKFGYMSPEQVSGQAVDHRSDVFAIGTVLFELITADRLFLGESDFATLEKVRNVEVPRPSVAVPGCPPELERIIQKALARELPERYAWAADMERDLRAWLSSLGTAFGPKELADWIQVQFAAERRREAAALEEQQTAFEELRRAATSGVAGMTATSATGMGEGSSERTQISHGQNGGAAHALTSGAYRGSSQAAAAGGTYEVLSTPGYTGRSDPVRAHNALEAHRPQAQLWVPRSTPKEVPAVERPDDGSGGGGGSGGANGGVNGSGGDSDGKSASTSGAFARRADGDGAYRPLEVPSSFTTTPVAGRRSEPNPKLDSQLPPSDMPAQATAIFEMPSAPPATSQAMSRAPITPPGGHAAGHAAMAPPRASVEIYDKAPARSTLTKDIVLGLALALILIAGVVAARVFVLHSRAGTLVVTVVPPSSAMVVVDGDVRGRISSGRVLTIKNLGAGSHHVRVSSDSGEFEETVTLVVGDATVVTASLHAVAGVPPVPLADEVEEPKLRPGRARLIVRSDPPGGEVNVNGRMIGFTPVEASDLTPEREVRVTVRKRGYSTGIKYTSFEFNRDQTLDFTLSEASQKSDEKSGDSSKNGDNSKSDSAQKNGAASGSATSGSGSETSAAPAKTDTTPAKSDSTTAAAAPAASTSGSTAATGNGASAKSAPPPPPAVSPNEPGFLIANSQPWAKVYIDGKDTGRSTPISPKGKISLKPGKHVVTFVLGKKKWNWDIVIKPAEDTKLIKTLGP